MFGFFLIGYVIFVTGGSRQHLYISHAEQLHFCRSVIGLRNPACEARQMTNFALGFPEQSRICH